MRSYKGDRLSRNAASLLVGAALSLLIGASPCTIYAHDASDWRTKVSKEHLDRIRRLRQISARVFEATPEFYVDLIRAAEMPKDIGIDIPVTRVVFSQLVFFDTGQSTVRSDSTNVIDVIASALHAEKSEIAVIIAGHTDSRGSDDYNYKLSTQRANSVASLLSDQGIDQASIWRVGFGKAVPLVSNATPEGTLKEEGMALT